uniref:Uncharacterized protein n=1 Tax=Amphora coffeiformis TaxID=265554 RepID=A0A7S3P844_9STRA|mmetsp:Transcript_14991/g.28402  ORF Transcript_14991/g.28402 Transcript_14991/m.28402 type:complete len:119 (+) Transcript_14991:162-518(+)
MGNETDDYLYVNDRFICRISEVKMPTLRQGGENQPSRRHYSPMAVKLSDKRVKESLVQVKSLAESLLCSATTCVAARHDDFVVKQVNSFQQDEGGGDDEAVEIGEESLLRKDYGIYRV